MKVSVWVLVVLVSLISFKPALAEDCLDGAVAVNLVNSTLVNSLIEPNTTNDIILLIQSLSTILTANPSPYAINIAVGYPSNKYISVESCSIISSPCFSIKSGFYARVVLPSNGNVPYIYEISSNTINISNPLSFENPFYPTQRPWYNSNGWSAIYQYVNLPTNGRTYEITQQSTGAHVMSDRISYEPCNQCLSSSPANNAAQYLSASPLLANWQNLSTTAQVRNALSTLLTSFMIPLQVSTSIASMGPGYSNGDFYFITDCNAYPDADQSVECGNSEYFGEVKNQRVYGDTIYVYALNASGSISAQPRNSLTTFNTTSRPWYQLLSGWTDPYVYATGSMITARTYAAKFNGGVIDVDPNPNNVCPTPSALCPTYSPSPSAASPSPSTTTCGSASTLSSLITSPLKWLMASS